ncbi:DUF4019 domain-containing protein [Sphingomonas sp. TF3]|uniref:helix-turn-helix domain-containing protein n=1 Tax=Sphingomonas sp. TF3 TaxID=2495580 RepID=UPI000F89038F|nr:DUF4019 domain-containing protein [Sphingomonas sp. TF3]RUN77479.1 DUF4019 domain-containing protein [Sphingomonas sp. TF3]
MPGKDAFWALTEKEKQTLRLIVRGHDAKSVARNLGLSVHTINERLRDARRKMAVSSSREAARLLLDAEGSAGFPPPDFLGDVRIGDDAIDSHDDQDGVPVVGAGRTYRPTSRLIGVVLMTLVLSLLVLVALPQRPTTAPPTATTAPAHAEAVAAALNWLDLVDHYDWDASYRGTGPAFRKQNTLQVWSRTSQQVRVPLGAVISRGFVSEEDVPAPPAGYTMVKFRTSFANKADAIETVTLDRVDGRWQIVGVTIG